MAKDKAVWGIDIGQRALKALKLQDVGGELQATAFDIVEHAEILSGPEADHSQLIRAALEQFLSRNSIVGSTVCVAVPGQSSFTRFVKLPPVEPKKIPDIVRFEAEQQIPFAISDVIWRWQTFHDPDSPDVEVGIFAMKREDIAAVLEHFSAVGIDVDIVQMSPLALYNFMSFDGQAAPEGATLLADIGADKTDLVVSDGPRIWTRTIQIGGNNFTEALVRSFKLSFAKADKLKRTAASSKYARQIFQAMRPVFADLVQEAQRSVGYYTSLHRDARFKRLLGLGNGFRLPGLQKFLEQNLGMPVVRIDNYNKLKPAPGVNTPVFTDNVMSFAVSYGLALQGVSEAPVSTNLLPAQIVRTRQWQRKRPWFAGVAGVILLILAIMLYRAYHDKSALAIEPGGAFAQAERINEESLRLKKSYGGVVSKGKQEVLQAQEFLKLYSYRDYWPSALGLVFQGVAAHASDQGLLDEYAAAQDEEARQAVLAKIKAKRRSSRRMFFLESMESKYMDNVYQDPKGSAAPGGKSGSGRGFQIVIQGRTPLAEEDSNRFLADIFRTWYELAEQYENLSVVSADAVYRKDTASGRGGRSGKGKFDMMALKSGPGMLGGQSDTDQPQQVAQEPDPLFPEDAFEDMAKDTRFTITLRITIEDVQPDAL